MNKKINRKSSFIVHDIFRAVFVLTLGILINVAGGGVNTYALPSISVSSDSNVTIAGDDTGGYITPSSTGALGVGVDHVNINTSCTSGYKLYVSSTNAGTTDLVMEDATDPTDITNRISSSTTNPGFESPLSKNTWGVGKNGSDFSKLQEYNPNTGLLTPIYSGTNNSLFNIYYGINVSTDKNPGVYSGNVLYTAVLDDACLRYTLDFDTSSATSVDTSVIKSQSINYGTDVDLSVFSANTIINRTGYTLTGWEYTINGDRREFPITANQNINPTDASSITLIPVWTPISYSLIYEAGETNGYCTHLSVPVTYDSNITLAGVTCTKLGHTQDGWSSSPFEDNTKEYDLSAELIKPNFRDTEGTYYTLYPHFAINSNLLTTNINTADTDKIASISPSTGNVEYDAEVTTSCVPNAGYHCTGWTSVDEDILPSYAAPSYTFNMPDSPVTLTASAAANTYTIRYNANGGTGNTESQTGATYGSTVALRANGFQRAGHHFKGWAYSDAATESDFTSGQTIVSVSELAENNASGSVVATNGGIIDLYAVWDVNNYTFIFDTNGATGAPASASSSASYDGAIVPPGVGTMQKTGHDFAGGWSLDRTSENAEYSSNVAQSVSEIVNAANKANENNAEITLYAVWSGYPYTLTTVNGNTTAISSISPSGNTTKLYGSLATVECTSKSGYHCTGWTSNNTSKLESSSNASYTFTMPDSDITLTATGAANTYTIRYNPNPPSGYSYSGSTSNTTGATYGSTTTLATNGYSINGFTFQGWAYNPSATNRDFTNGQSSVSVSTLATNNYSGSVVNTNGGIIDLYAVWKGNSYTIAYSAGNTGGSCSVSSTSATYGSYATLSSTKCTKTGHDQDGWSTSNSSSNSKDYNLGASVKDLATSGTTYLYPHFKPNSYTLTVNPNGCTWNGTTSTSTFTQDYGTTKTISNPSCGSWTVYYNQNSQGATFSSSSTSVSKTFSGWSKSGTGSLSGTTWTFGAGNGTLTAGVSSGSITLQPISKSGYTCSWAEGSASGTRYSAGTTRTINGNTNYYAVCTANTYSVTIYKGTGISSVTGAGSYTAGQRVDIGASVSNGYSFSSWSVDSGSASLNSRYSSSTYFTMPSGNVTLTANAQANTYTVTINKGTGISSVSGAGSYTAGQTVNISATASSGYNFSSWTVNSGGISTPSGSSTSFTMPAGNVTLTANGAESVKNCSSTVHPGTTATTGCKMADGKTWVFGNSGTRATWITFFTGVSGSDGTNATVKSGICPSGFSAPTKNDYQTLMNSYSGGGLYTALGATSSNDAQLWSATEKSWNGSAGTAYRLNPTSSSASITAQSTGNGGKILCYK